ncbi:MAG: hypothetical protein LBP91_05075, partial [Coriobacteriales bacterium]|nr:hypothetical protein [Coriobacteriales bacterium]
GPLIGVTGPNTGVGNNITVYFVLLVAGALLALSAALYLALGTRKKEGMASDEQEGETSDEQESAS